MNARLDALFRGLLPPEDTSKYRPHTGRKQLTKQERGEWTDRRINRVMGRICFQLTLEELHAERDYWDAVYRAASTWGATMTVAASFRDECDARIREIIAQTEAHKPIGTA